jgi:hypothetical protein
MKHPDQDRTVLDPRWEDDLRAGHDADGGQGSVERELEVLHVLRHARAPEPIDDARLDALWGEIEAQAFPSAHGTTWWRRRWWVALVPAATAAVVLFFVVPRQGGDGLDRGDAASEPVARADAAPTSGRPSAAQAASAEDAMLPAAAPAERAEEKRQRSIYEEQFAALAPRSRVIVAGAVDDGRGKLRAELIADARLAGAPSADAVAEPPTELRETRSRSAGAGASGLRGSEPPPEREATSAADAEADADAETNPPPRPRAGGQR